MPPRRAPKFVTIPPWDDGKNLAPVFFEDPRTWTPKKDLYGRVEFWGLDSDYDESISPPGDDMMIMMSRLMGGNDYIFKNTEREKQGLPRIEKPEHQFVQVLMERKRAELAARDVAISAMQKCDVVLQVTLGLDGTEHSSLAAAKLPPIMRRLRVSAGMKLTVFQDKVLAPSIGWDRNFHAWIFTDFRDGAQFGTKQTAGASIDFMHSDRVGFKWLEAKEYTIAHLFDKEGDMFGYLYDFGDRFKHKIEIVSIFSEEDSTGDVTLLEGAGACPGENMDGNMRYGKKLAAYRKASATDRLAFKNEILSCPNHESYQGRASNFDPFVFDLLAGQRRLGVALASKQSDPTGAKVHVMSFAPENSYDMHTKVGKNQVHEKTHTGPSQFWSEVKNTGLDAAGTRVCSVCGKSREKDLKKCSGCQLVSYCGPVCQNADWVTHKVACKQAKAKKEGAR